MNQIGFIGDEAIKHVGDFQNFFKQGRIHFWGHPGHVSQTFIFPWTDVASGFFAGQMQPIKRRAGMRSRRGRVDVQYGGIITNGRRVHVRSGDAFCASADLYVVMA